MLVKGSHARAFALAWATWSGRRRAAVALLILMVCLLLTGTAALAAPPASPSPEPRPGRDLLAAGPLADLHDVHFVTAQLGWVVGAGGTIRFSNDGGRSWSPQTSGVTEDLLDVHFVDSSTGWVVGAEGVILHTANAGLSWAPQQSNTSERLTAVDFVDALHGWIAGSNTTLLATADGGQSWAPQAPPVGYEFFSAPEMDFWDLSHGWVAPWGGWPGGGLLATGDGGTTWVTQTTGLVYYLKDVDFVSATEGWAVGYSIGSVCRGRHWAYYTHLFHTVDGGVQWAESAPVCGLPEALDFIDASNGWLLLSPGWGHSLVLSTGDGGVSWGGKYRSDVLELSAIQMADSASGWAVGKRGFVARIPGQVYLPLVSWEP